MGTVIGGKYQLISEVPSDAADVCWEAEDRAGARVFVRFLGGGADPRRALAAGTGLVGPHFHPIRDAGGDGRAYVVYPKLSGQTLESLVRAQGPLVPVVAARLVCQAATALRDARLQGHAHLGIDPAWLYLCVEDTSQIIVKVAGFGLPGGDDMWALGAALYLALAGVAVRAPGFPPLQAVAPWIAAPLAEVVHACLLEDPARRCADVGDLIRQLELRAGGAGRLRPGMLTGAPPHQRAQREAVAELPTSWSDVVEATRPLSGPAHTPESLVGKTIGHGYALAGILGRGAMGTVYEAVSEKDRVAIKIIQTGDRDDGATIDVSPAKRFVREARAAQSIDSPHVVRVHDLATDRKLGKPYIVMELLRGRDLNRVIEEVGPLDPPVAVRIILQACEGLHAAHERSIVHRDIKPSNLFLHEEGDAIIVKVCDFGTAKLVLDARAGDTKLTATGTFLGSPRYMSPEQASDPRAADARSDIWSLCVSLYQALAGSHMWPQNTVGALMEALATREVRPLRSVASWIAPELAAVVHHGLVRDPARRLQTVDQMAAALQPFAGGGVEVRRADLRPCPEGMRPEHDPMAATLSESGREP